jgi:hypothetical protein
MAFKPTVDLPEIHESNINSIKSRNKIIDDDKNYIFLITKDRCNINKCIKGTKKAKIFKKELIEDGYSVIAFNANELL